MLLFLRSLTAAAVLAHALFGCGEHDHAAAATDGASSALLHADHGSNCHAHEQEAREDSPPASLLEASLLESGSLEGGPLEGGPCNQGPCSQGRCDCQWLSGTALVLELDHDCQQGCRLPADPILCIAACKTVECSNDWAIGTSAALGLRAHLAPGVMLL